MSSCSGVTRKIQSSFSHDQTPLTESKVAAPAEHTNTVVAIAQARIPSLASATEGKGATLTSPVTLITPAAQYNARPVPLSSTITTTLAQAPSPFSIISRGGSTSSSSSSLRTSNLPTIASSSATLPRDPLAPPEDTLASLISALPDMSVVLFDCPPDSIKQVEAYIRDIWQRFTDLDASLAICQHNIEAINEKLRLLAGLVRLDQRITDTPLFIANNSSPTATEPRYSLTSGRVTTKDIINRLPNDLILHTFAYLDFRSQLHMCAISKNIPNLILCKSKLITMSPSMLIHKALSYRKDTFSYREEVMQFNFSARNNPNATLRWRNIIKDIRPAQKNLEILGEALKTALMQGNWAAVCVLLKQVIAFAKWPTNEPVILSSIPQIGDQKKWEDECLQLCPQINQGAWPAMLDLLSIYADNSFVVTLRIDDDLEKTVYPVFNLRSTTTAMFLRMHFLENHNHDIRLWHNGRTMEMEKTFGDLGVARSEMMRGLRITSTSRNQLPKIEVTQKLRKQYARWKEFGAKRVRGGELSE